MPNFVFVSCVIVVLLAVHPPSVNASRRSGSHYRSRPRVSPPAQTPPQSCTPAEQGYLFAVSGDVRPNVYFDSNGTLAGFLFDLIEAVCRIAGKTCRWTLVPWTVCAQTVSDKFAPGDYLMGGDVDSCSLYTINNERKNSVDFTDPFYRSEDLFFTMRNQNAATFNPNNLSGRRIAVRRGFFTNEFCIRASGVPMTGVTFMVVDAVADGVVAVKNGVVDAFFYTRNLGLYDTTLTSILSTFTCGATGGFMVKKGSDIPGWWNPAFRTFVSTRGYAHLCAAAPFFHGGVARCL